MKQTAKHNLAALVTRRIEQEHIQPRSTASIVLEQLAFACLLLVVFTAAVLAINWLGFWFRASGLGAFLGYGTNGVIAVLESLPHGAVILGLGSLVGSLLLLRHYDVSYRHPFVLLSGTTVALALIIGIGLAATGVNERLATRADQDDLPVLQGLYAKRLNYEHHSQRAIAGPIVALDDGRIVVGVRTANLAVDTNETTVYPAGKPMVGDHVRILIVRPTPDHPVARVIILRQRPN